MKNALLIRDVCSLLIYLITLVFIFSVNKTYGVIFAALHLVRIVATATHNTIGLRQEKEALAEFEYLMSMRKEEIK